MDGPQIRRLDLAEAMALAVLKGDQIAALALAGMLVEANASGGRGAVQEAAKSLRESGAGLAHGHECYRWPEFKAFADRLGVLWDHLTVDLTIRIPCDGLVEIVHKYRSSDTNQT